MFAISLIYLFIPKMMLLHRGGPRRNAPLSSRILSKVARLQAKTRGKYESFRHSVEYLVLAA
jgi:hypothetical protein